MVEALTNAANTKIDQLVADGKIQQDRADTIKGKVPARVDTLMNRQFGQHAPAPRELIRAPGRPHPARRRTGETPAGSPTRRASPRSAKLPASNLSKETPGGRFLARPQRGPAPDPEVGPRLRRGRRSAPPPTSGTSGRRPRGRSSRRRRKIGLYSLEFVRQRLRRPHRPHLPDRQRGDVLGRRRHHAGDLRQHPRGLGHRRQRHARADRRSGCRSASARPRRSSSARSA